MIFKKIDKIHKYSVYVCPSCNKEINAGSLEFMENHYKTCACNHTFSEWSTMNLGTWPDYEPHTSRRCSKCNHSEVK